MAVKIDVGWRGALAPRPFYAAEESDVSDLDSTLRTHIRSVEKGLEKGFEKALKVIEGRCDSIESSQEKAAAELKTFKAELVKFDRKREELRALLAAGGPLEEVFTRICDAQLARIDQRTAGLSQIAAAIETAREAACAQLANIVQQAEARAADLLSQGQSSAAASQSSALAAAACLDSLQQAAIIAHDSLKATTEPLTELIQSHRATATALNQSIADAAAEFTAAQLHWREVKSSVEATVATAANDARALFERTSELREKLRSDSQAAETERQALWREASRFSDFHANYGATFWKRLSWLFRGAPKGRRDTPTNQHAQSTDTRPFDASFSGCQGPLLKSDSGRSDLTGPAAADSSRAQGEVPKIGPESAKKTRSRASAQL